MKTSGGAASTQAASFEAQILNPHCGGLIETALPKPMGGCRECDPPSLLTRCAEQLWRVQAAYFAKAAKANQMFTWGESIKQPH